MFSRRTAWKLAPNRFAEAQREMAAADREVLDLTVSNPTRAGFHYDQESILNSLTNPKALDYDPQPKGLRGAREAVGAYYREQYKEDIDPDSLVLTTSTSEGYSYVFRLRSEEHTSELQSQSNLVCRLLLEKKKKEIC